MNEATNNSARVSGQDRKIPPALGTNQITGSRGFRPLSSLEKTEKMVLNFACLILAQSLDCARTARIKLRDFFKIATIAKFSKNKIYVNHQNPKSTMKSRLKIDV